MELDEEMIKRLYDEVPPCKFQQESLVVQLNLSVDTDVKDWDWGLKFNVAGYKEDRSDLKAENRMFQVRLGTAMKDKDSKRLPYLGKKALKTDNPKKNDKIPDKEAAKKESKDGGTIVEESEAEEVAPKVKNNPKFKRLEDANKHFRNVIIREKRTLDYLKESIEKKQAHAERKARNQGGFDVNILLAKAGSNSRKLKELILMNHQSPVKLKKSIKMQKDRGYDEIKR